jgi:adenylate kinase family enzyme
MNKIQKIAVIGISGSGKTTFSETLSKKLGLPLYHMDSLFWLPNWTEVQSDVWQLKEQEIIDQKQWIIEGYVDEISVERLSEADLVLYIDLPGYICAFNGLKRWWQYRGKSRPELDNCNETLKPSYLWTILIKKERIGLETALKQVSIKNLIKLDTINKKKSYLRNLI